MGVVTDTSCSSSVVSGTEVVVGIVLGLIGLDFLPGAPVLCTMGFGVTFKLGKGVVGRKDAEVDSC